MQQPCPDPWRRRFTTEQGTFQRLKGETMIDVRDAHNPMCDRYHYKHKSYRCTCLEWKHMLENPPYQEWLDRAEFVMEMERQRPRQRFTRIFRPMSPATDRQVGRLVAAMGITYCTLAPMVVVAGWSMGWFEK